jgi:hypothetical protein
MKFFGLLAVAENWFRPGFVCQFMLLETMVNRGEGHISVGFEPQKQLSHRIYDVAAFLGVVLRLRMTLSPPPLPLSKYRSLALTIAMMYIGPHR